MRLSQRIVGLWLTEDAGRVAEFAEMGTTPYVYIVEEDSRGLWIKTTRVDGDHFVLIRWQYVALVDITIGGAKTIGLKPE